MGVDGSGGFPLHRGMKKPAIALLIAVLKYILAAKQ